MKDNGDAESLITSEEKFWIRLFFVVVRAMAYLQLPVDEQVIRQLLRQDSSIGPCLTYTELLDYMVWEKRQFGRPPKKLTCWRKHMDNCPGCALDLFTFAFGMIEEESPTPAR